MLLNVNLVSSVHRAGSVDAAPLRAWPGLRLRAAKENASQFFADWHGPEPLPEGGRHSPIGQVGQVPRTLYITLAMDWQT